MTDHDGACDIANKYEAIVQGYNPIKAKTLFWQVYFEIIINLVPTF